MGLKVAPLVMFIFTQIVILIMGMFMSPGPILMVSLPLFLPIIRSFGFNEIWFAVITLLNIEMATTSPPFGLNLFVMKGSAPAGTTMGDIYRAALPFLYCDLIAMALIFIFPSLALWLPNVGGRP
jgi:TRAP-type C4-dicarboxylate transport system permease large subunit